MTGRCSAHVNAFDLTFALHVEIREQRYKTNMTLCSALRYLTRLKHVNCGVHVPVARVFLKHIGNSRAFNAAILSAIAQDEETRVPNRISNEEHWRDRGIFIPSLSIHRRDEISFLKNSERA